MEKILTYELITKENLDLAIKIQNTIFPHENGAQNFIDSINHDPYRKELVNWLVFCDKDPIGIIGLYSYHEYPDDAFMGWYGVLPSARGKGYGSKIFDFFEDTAKKKDYKNIRLYTDDIANYEATKLYYKKGMLSEEYFNPEDVVDSTGKTLIFSKSLSEKTIEKWNNKHLGLADQIKKQNYMI